MIDNLLISDICRLDFVSDTCEVWLTFHSDFSVSGDGFHAVWSTVHLLGCPQQSIDQPEGQLFSPYYPTYYLPYLNCTYHLIAPGSLFLSFFIVASFFMMMMIN